MARYAAERAQSAPSNWSRPKGHRSLGSMLVPCLLSTVKIPVITYKAIATGGCQQPQSTNKLLKRLGLFF
ncbi:protein of unknown function (plasmid) [Rhodovastum atsumiense]|nr:protein of unknown function [Rhodovastum atsumiense]